jgi:hypothetical protein
MPLEAILLNRLARLPKTRRRARRMAESAALLVDEVFPEQAVRQWVLSFPYPLRFLFASRPAIMGKVLGIVYRVIATHLIKKAGFSCKTAHTGAVTFIQRAAAILNVSQKSGKRKAKTGEVKGIGS